MRSVILILGCVVVNSFGQLFLKKGMTSIGKIGFELGQLVPTLTSAFGNFFVLLGFFLYGVSALLWMIVLSRVDLSFAYPFVSLSYVMVILFSCFLLKENLPWIRIVGVLVICSGVYLVSRS
ncbi:MAG: EamA family transporter [candidate division Zixibacteria bacterium]|nr:EamA family transporter [candidate division Zixibacteria bacterium]